MPERERSENLESQLHRHTAIPGGSVGIGLPTARLAAERGATITLGGRDQGRLNAAAGAVAGASALAVDAEDPASLAEFFRAAGPIDDLVITITRRGHRKSRDAARLGEADLVSSFGGNAIATLRAVGEALASLSEHRSITLTGGITARSAFPGTAEPAAVNGAVESAILALIENQFITGVVLPVDGGLRLA